MNSLEILALVLIINNLILIVMYVARPVPVLLPIQTISAEQIAAQVEASLATTLQPAIVTTLSSEPTLSAIVGEAAKLTDAHYQELSGKDADFRAELDDVWLHVENVEDQFPQAPSATSGE